MIKPPINVETAVKALVDGLGDLDAQRQALAQVALTLAARLDEADHARSPALAKELRATLDELRSEDDVDVDDWTAPADPAQVRDAAEPVKGDVRPRSGRSGPPARKAAAPVAAARSRRRARG